MVTPPFMPVEGSSVRPPIKIPWLRIEEGGQARIRLALPDAGPYVWHAKKEGPKSPLRPVPHDPYDYDQIDIYLVERAVKGAPLALWGVSGTLRVLLDRLRVDCRIGYPGTDVRDEIYTVERHPMKWGLTITVGDYGSLAASIHWEK